MKTITNLTKLLELCTNPEFIAEIIKLLKQGSSEELANDPMVRKVYLGQNFQLRKPRVQESN